jgi:hypothetical protein
MKKAKSEKTANRVGLLGRELSIGVEGRTVGIAAVMGALAHAERAETFLPETRRAARKMRKKLEQISGVSFKSAPWPRKPERDVGVSLRPRPHMPR